MPSSTTSDHCKPSPRISDLKFAVQSAMPSVCTERALLWTAYHRKKENRKKSAFIQMAEALSYVLSHKQITIHADELLVGNYTSKRVGGGLYPELHGVPVMFDLLRFPFRKTNPLAITLKEILSLARIIPFWLLRFLALQAYSSPIQKIRLAVNQLRAHFYLINEGGGISHLAPDYAKLIRVGTNGLKSEARTRQQKTRPGSEQWEFLQAVQIIADGLAHFGRRYADLARRMAASEANPARKAELETIAEVCGRCLTSGATTFREALQAVFFTQIAINLESLDNSVCPGRMDQYLYPFYQKDLEQERLDKETAKELIAAFSIKMSEIIPVFSAHLTHFHGGMFNGQVVTVGGINRSGKDAVNELSYLFLEVMDDLRMRQPNFHARVHTGTSPAYYERISRLLAGGANSPALYNDDAIVPTLCRHGYSLEDARDYTAVGCVEPVCQGKSFSSTDAAIFNVPVVLEMALNQGRRFGSPIRTGVKTPPVTAMKDMDDVTSAFETQLKHMLGKLIRDLQAVELANRRLHPTPLTSMLLDGCLATATCSTAGGAAYNFSGVQCVAPVDIGDALYAIEQSVFVEKKLSLPELTVHLKTNLKDPDIRGYLQQLPKFGNDNPDVDQWTLYVVNRFAETLASFGDNTRGGPYTTGLYSVTAHEFFGRITGALPNGRRKGEAFASGISPGNGMDRNGPTALINSVNRLDFTRTANGINFNIKFDPHTLRGETGVTALGALLKTYFRRGGMQVQVNVLDPAVLLEARRCPEQYPNLLVRVSGYSAYFNDLSPAMKDEIIQRTCLSV